MLNNSIINDIKHSETDSEITELIIKIWHILMWSKKKKLQQILSAICLRSF